MTAFVEFQLVSDEITLSYDLGKVVCGQGYKLSLPADTSEQMLIEQAMILARKHWRDGYTLLTRFSAYQNIIAKVGNHRLRSEQPIGILPTCYFGQVQQMTEKHRRVFADRGLKHFVRTSSDEMVPLIPTDRVYDTKGQLAHIEPA